MNILVVAAHPDDEVLGMGATIKKLAEKGHKIHLCVISEGVSAQYKNDLKMKKIRKESCIKAGKILGISSIDFFEFPDGQLDTIPQLEINNKLEKIISKFQPKIVYTTSNHDMSIDHQKVFNSTIVASRPQSSSVKQVLCYEILGSIKSPFEPNCFEDVTKHFEAKIKAFKQYNSEIEKFPHPRSFEAIENLAIYRGMESGLKKAEAFRLVRSIN